MCQGGGSVRALAAPPAGRLGVGAGAAGAGRMLVGTSLNQLLQVRCVCAHTQGGRIGILLSEACAVRGLWVHAVPVDKWVRGGSIG